MVSVTWWSVVRDEADMADSYLSVFYYIIIGVYLISWVHATPFFGPGFRPGCPVFGRCLIFRVLSCCHLPLGGFGGFEPPEHKRSGLRTTV